ncbi:hypothetical protein SDC9_31320 [bioreactor metagenome]|jgi:hypothetical protein|uniref:Uncharacterized protein n=1 Tax=bioreactor metagenome TaxID=1076179 RepID=A0A644V3C7_9ZZZZ|nr:hypothetical protein [Paludibacter sp.]
MQNNKRQISGYLLTILFVFYFASTNFFKHTHIDENNRLIVHSHPFSSESNHQHHTASFQLIDKLSGFVAGLIILGMSLLAISELSSCLTVSRGEHVRTVAFLTSCFSRPPPKI